MPSPAGKGDRAAVDEESICRANLSDGKITQKHPPGVLTPDKVGKAVCHPVRLTFICSPHPPLSRSPFSAGEGKIGENITE